MEWSFLTIIHKSKNKKSRKTRISIRTRTQIKSMIMSAWLIQQITVVGLVADWMIYLSAVCKSWPVFNFRERASKHKWPFRRRRRDTHLKYLCGAQIRYFELMNRSYAPAHLNAGWIVRLLWRVTNGWWLDADACSDRWHIFVWICDWAYEWIQ